MVNFSNRSKKGQVTVRIDSGSVKACFPRNYFDDGKQVRLATGISIDENWESIANKLQRRLQLELEDGKLANDGIFNLGKYQEILEDYGLRVKLKLVRKISDDSTPVPQLTVLEIWDNYCEYRKHDLKESTYIICFRRTYRNFVVSAIKAIESEDAIKIRNWMIENRNFQKSKQIINYLSKAHALAIRQGLITINPYDGLAEDMKIQGCKGFNIASIKQDDDTDVLERNKAYTWSEALAILDYVRTNGRISHWYHYIAFKFYTGCRSGEGIALMWQDIKWEREQILIRRNYSEDTRKFYNLKNADGNQLLVRIFPMPKDGILWNLLKSLPEGKYNDVVFKSKMGKIICDSSFSRAWRGRNESIKGIIPELIERGVLIKYLPPYNTRHTFITHQIFDLGRDSKVVSAWCGHNETISVDHYQDIERIATSINPEI